MSLRGEIKMGCNDTIRKVIRKLSILLAIWLLAGLVLSPGTASAQKSEDELIVGMVSAVEGEVEAQVEGEASWEKLALKDDLYLGDTIRTQTNSKVKMVFKDDSTVSLGPQSVMQIKVFDYAPQKEQRVSTFAVAQGKARAVVGRLFGSDSKFEIETPTAIAGVRGTFFMVWVLSPEVTRVFVLEGKVSVRNVKPEVTGEVIVTEGKTTTVQEAAPPAAAKKATKEEIQEGQSETQVEGEEEAEGKGAAEEPKDALSKVKERHENAITGKGSDVITQGTQRAQEINDVRNQILQSTNRSIITLPPGTRPLPTPQKPPQ